MMQSNRKTPSITRWKRSRTLITALIDHMDAKLVIALSCFLGLGPAEIGGLQWGDVDAGWINLRRNKVRGDVTKPKTKERMAPVPLLDEVRVPLELWRGKCDNPHGENWVIADLPNMINRVIMPHVIGEKECDRWCSGVKAITFPVRSRSVLGFGRKGDRNPGTAVEKSVATLDIKQRVPCL
jgi:integrase